MLDDGMLVDVPLYNRTCRQSIYLPSMPLKKGASVGLVGLCRWN